MKLNNKQISQLKGLAHHLEPVVIIGQNGLNDAVIKEVNNSLKAHELIKIRVLGDDRESRINIIEPLCQETNAILVQHIGKLLVLYKPNLDNQKIKLV